MEEQREIDGELEEQSVSGAGDVVLISSDESSLC